MEPGLVKATTKTKPWEDSWQILKELPGGGQASTFVVQRRGGADDQKYALKTLRRQDDPERRRRMHGEVQALQQLAHPRLPKIIQREGFDAMNLSVALIVAILFTVLFIVF